MATTVDDVDQSVWVCERCREEIARDAQVCPHCGYKAKQPFRSRLKNAQYRLSIFAWAVTIVGLPMARRRYRQYKDHKGQYDRGPAVQRD